MKKKTRRFLASMPKRAGSITLSVAMVAGSLYNDSLIATAADTGNYWKSDVMTALDELSEAQEGAEEYSEAVENLQEAYDSLVGARSVENLCVTAVTEDTITLEWSTFDDENLLGYNVYWADNNSETAIFQLLDAESNNCYDDSKCTIDASKLEADEKSVTFVVNMSTNKNHWFKVAPVTKVGAGSKCEAVMSPTAIAYTTQLENISRGLTVTMTENGAYLNWRLLASELDGGYTQTGLTGLDFNVYRDDELIATVTDSTNYLDTDNTTELTDTTYKLVPVTEGTELSDQMVCAYDIFTKDNGNDNVAYTDIPLQKPADTTIAQTYGISEIALGGYTMTDSGYVSADDVITYSANDMSVGDVDGDGEYEYLVQWEPSYSKDVSQQGYTGKTYIDCYELDGTLLWRLDLGVNIRAGAHYTQFGLYDYDGDGKSELMLKTAPGTKMTKYELDSDGKNIWEGGSLKVASTDYVNNTAKGKSQGATDQSDYVFSAADYREYLIEVFKDWGVWSRYSEKTVSQAIDGHWSDNLVEMFTTSDKWSDSTFYTGEVASSANVTKNMKNLTTEDIQGYLPQYQEGDLLVNVALRDEAGNVRYVSNNSGVNPVMKTVRVQDVKDYYGGYDLEIVNKDVKDIGYSEEEATILADYYLNHYQYRMKKHNLNTWEGYVVTGPEYITLYSGEGVELDTQDWYYGREDDGMLWGDYAMNYIEPGNRVDRYNVAVAYLDGETPSCIMGRGYYTRTTMVAYNVVDKKLQVAGAIDSGWTVMNNPFNDGPHGYDGCDEVNGTLSGQGDHYIAVADIDGDGRQDIVNGGAIVSYKNGNLYLYSSGGDYLNGGSGSTWAKYGHGDAIHITDIDPDHPGLEIASCFEGGASAPYNWAVRDAKSNKVLFGAPGTTDYGRIIVGDVLANVRGLEIDAGYDAKGNKVSLTGVSNNMNIKWSPNMTTQFVSGTTNTTIIGNVDGKSHTFLNASGYSTNNGTKGNPGLVADLFGDFREEIILRKADNSSLRIYMNTEVNEHKNYTLMHNAQYRVGIASQNSSYNQPAYTDYYYASDTDWSRVLVPNTPSDQTPGAVVVNPASVSVNVTSKTLLPQETLQLEASVIPSAADQTVVWTSDKKEVATVDANGFVTAVTNGTAYITATTVNGKTVTCKVSVVGDYKDDGIDQMPIGESYTFKFGSKAEGERIVHADSLYDSEKGYGWAAHNYISMTDGADYVAATNYRSSDSIPVYEYPTFEIDVPVGIYEVTIVQGTNASEPAVNGAYVEGNKYAVRWSDESFATSYTEPTEDSWIWTQAGQTKTTTVDTAVADGKLTVALATSLTDDGVSGTTYIKEIIVTRKAQITSPSSQPTLRFIGDSTLAKYPPEDGGNWTPIPERTGWGEDFSMGRFTDDEVVLVNKAVAGSSVKSYIYDGYLNDFLLNSHPGDTVIIEGGINDSAAGPRYSTADEFKTTLEYVINCCQAFGLDVILSSGTSSSSTYTTPMKALAEEKQLNYVDLATEWTKYQSTVGRTQGNMTVDGTHLRRVGAVVAAQLVANSIADIEGLYVSGHILKTPVNYEKPTATVTGLYAKTQTQGSVTLAWNIAEENLYQPNQLIMDFNIYRKEKGSSKEAELVATQTAYVSAGMNGPQLYTTVEMPSTGTYNFYVTCEGLTGEGPKSAEITVNAFTPDARYCLQDYIEKYETQFYDASVYTVESYTAVKLALEAGKQILADEAASLQDIENALAQVETAIAALEQNATTLERTDYQNEALTTAPWGVTGSHKTLMSAKMESDGNRLLNLYVEAAGSRSVNKIFSQAAGVNANTQLIEFVWYPGNPDQRNVTEVEFYSTDSNRVLSLKTASNGHIGYVTGNYPSNSTAYMTGTGFHAYEGSKAVDLELTNEAWYNVKLVMHYDTQTADLYIQPRDNETLQGTVVKDISIDTAGSNSITKLNYLLMRGKQDNGTSNDLSILWDSYYDDFAMYYSENASDAQSSDKAEYQNALAAYEAKIKGLGSSVLSQEQFVKAGIVALAMKKDVGFFTQKDYAYATGILQEATKAAPEFVTTKTITIQTPSSQLMAGTTAKLEAILSDGANEEILWSSSDENIATVDAKGATVNVQAKQAGTVTITAMGETSQITGEIVLSVTGEAYFFGTQMLENAAYNSEKGYGFKDYTYPGNAKGWTSGISPDGDVYVGRTLVETSNVSYLLPAESGQDYVAVSGQNWTELPEGGRDEDKVPYQNTSAFVIDKENGNYQVSVTFYNPDKTAATAQVIAENIVRYSAGEHENEAMAATIVEAGQTATVTFPIALTDNQLTLRFVQNITDNSFETAAGRTVYVKSVSVDKYTAADRNKTAIMIAGDSTVQSYADKNYRASWAQLVYQLFGTPIDGGINDGTNTGYATYETQDTYIVNYARDARSTKSFEQEGRLNELLLNIQPGDYVLMQFAHNDDNQARSNRFVSVADFKKNILAYNQAITQRGATLVLVTPIAIGVWNEGKLDHRFDDYRMAMLDSGIPVLDLMGATLGLLADMGETNCNSLGIYKDTVHTYEAGAILYQRLVKNLLVAATDSKLAGIKSLMNVEASNDGIEATVDSNLLYIGDSQDIKITFGNQQLSPIATYSQPKVTYMTSDSTIVDVTESGKLIAGTKNGKAIITVSYTTGDLTTTDCTAYEDYLIIEVTDDASRFDKDDTTQKPEGGDTGNEGGNTGNEGGNTNNGNNTNNTVTIADVQNSSAAAPDLTDEALPSESVIADENVALSDGTVYTSPKTYDISWNTYKRRNVVSEAEVMSESKTESAQTTEDVFTEYDEQAWQNLDTAVTALKMKAAAFDDESTPFDYDVILVNKMVDTQNALNAVKDMALADTTEGDEIYELCEEAVDNSTLYTETSMELLTEAMEVYEEAVEALDIRKEIQNASEIIEFWLTGVKTEYEETPFAGYFDFNTTQTGGSSYNDNLVWEASGWTPVGITEGHPELTLYTQKRGYGMAAASIGRNRGTGDAVMDDFMIGGVFMVDLPAGNYQVTTYTGDLNSGCKGSASYKFYTGYESSEQTGELIASLAKETAPAATILERKVNFTLDEAATVTMVAAENGYTNAVIFEQIMSAQVEAYDVESLTALVEKIDKENLVETDYTLSSWKAFSEAYKQAKKAVSAGASFAQQIATVEKKLQETYEALTFRTANGQYAIDFGPAQESDSVSAQIAANILLSGYAPSNVALLKENELVLGDMLYSNHTNDNSLHYGFTSEVASGFTATGGAYFRDWVYGKGGQAYTFKADLPAGQYLVYVYTGCKEAANTTKFYFNNGEAAIASENSYTVVDGKAVYTQASSAGGQYAAPGCIYTVQVAPNGDALGYVKDVEMGTLSLTLFDDSEGLAQDAVTARLCGLGICRIGDYDAAAIVDLAEEVTEEETTEEETTEEETTEEETTEEETTEEETTEEETTEEEITEEETTEENTTEEETTEEKTTEEVMTEEVVAAEEMSIQETVVIE